MVKINRPAPLPNLSSIFHLHVHSPSLFAVVFMTLVSPDGEIYVSSQLVPGTAWAETVTVFLKSAFCGISNTKPGSACAVIVLGALGCMDGGWKTVCGAKTSKTSTSKMNSFLDTFRIGLNRSLLPFDQLICQLHQCLSSLALRIRLPQTVQRHHRQLTRRIICVFIRAFIGKQLC